MEQLKPLELYELKEYYRGWGHSRYRCLVDFLDSRGYNGQVEHGNETDCFYFFDMIGYENEKKHRIYRAKFVEKSGSMYFYIDAVAEQHNFGMKYCDFVYHEFERVES